MSDMVTSDPMDEAYRAWGKINCLQMCVSRWNWFKMHLSRKINLHIFCNL